MNTLLTLWCLRIPGIILGLAITLFFVGVSEGYGRVKIRGAALIFLVIGGAYLGVWLLSFLTKAFFGIDISFPTS